MASHRFTGTLRGAFTATAVLTAVSMTAPPSNAAPGDPTTSSEALKQFQDLSTQAEKVNEDLLEAQENLKTKQAELDKAKADTDQAKQAEARASADQDRFRGRVDQLTDASFQGARFNQLSALLTSDSARDFLDRASALRVLASTNQEMLDGLATTVAQTEDARTRSEDAAKRVQEAVDAAATLTNEVQQHKKDLDQQVAQVKQALNRLTAAERSRLAAATAPPPAPAPAPAPASASVSVSASAGKASIVVQAALSQLGKPYVWGAAGPDSYDCSGLTMWSYAKVGMSLPHSSRLQYTMGTAVARGAWQPGDLLFWGSDAASIHHVAIYIGNGEIVHASTEGVPVKVDTVAGGGSDYYGAKRLLG